MFGRKQNKYINKDVKLRLAVEQNEVKILALKARQHNLSLSRKTRLYALTRLAKQGRHSSRVRVINRCVITGRSRGVHNYFKISRIMIKELAAKALLPGLKKVS